VAWAATAAGTLTADTYVDYFCEASCKGGSNAISVAAVPNQDVVTLIYTDVGNSSYLTGTVAQFRSDIIDIRSGVASATYSLWLSPVYDYVATN
jgi:hypothetical protein